MIPAQGSSGVKKMMLYRDQLIVLANTNFICQLTPLLMNSDWVTPIFNSDLAYVQDKANEIDPNTGLSLQSIFSMYANGESITKLLFASKEV